MQNDCGNLFLKIIQCVRVNLNLQKLIDRIISSDNLKETNH